MDVVTELIRGRDAYDRLDWAAAHDALATRPPAELTAEDGLRLASAAYLLGNAQDCLRALEAAHRAHAESRDVAAAVRCAFWLGLVHFLSGDMAEGGGWMARGQRLLTEGGEDLPESGYMLIPGIIQSGMSGDFAGAVTIADQVQDAGRRFDDPDLIANGLHHGGRARLYLGEVREGVARMDEAMTWVTSGDVTPIFAGMIYCSTVEACQEISDLTRAEQWTTALGRWCDGQPDLVPFTGQCAVHRGQIMRLHGAYPEAVEEFGLAVRRYTESGASHASALAHYECGEVHRLMGDDKAAGAEYAAAGRGGWEPQPGLALLRLAQGRTEDAVAAMRRIAAEPLDVVHRSRFLPAIVEVLVASGEVAEAGTFATELELTASQWESRAMTARAASARGRVLLAEGTPSAALPHLRTARRVWDDIGDPHASVSIGVLVALALKGCGDEDSAALELTSAGVTARELGARPLLREIEALTGRPARDGLTDREVQVLRLVASGRTNSAIATELVLSEKTVARHLSNIFTKVGVSTRTAAAAYAYDHRLV